MSSYDETTSTVQDEDGNDVVTTQVTYAVDNAIAGDWVVHLHGVDEGDTDQNYIFTLIGAGLAPSLGNVNVVSTGDTTADVSWTLTNDAAPTVNIYATLGPTETEVTNPSDPTQTITLPVFGGERLLQVTDSTFDGTVNTRTIDLSGLENGEYYIHVEADDAKNPKQHQYWTDGGGNELKLAVNRPLPTEWNPTITVTPEYMGLHVAFTPLDNPNVDQFAVRFTERGGRQHADLHEGRLDDDHLREQRRLACAGPDLLHRSRCVRRRGRRPGRGRHTRRGHLVA